MHFYLGIELEKNTIEGYLNLSPPEAQFEFFVRLNTTKTIQNYWN